jgi:DNA-directed RNA polymerase subunit RPC12/RpoP
MSVSTILIEEAHCHICGHTWITRDEAERSCPECRRRVSEVVRKWKYRHLCLSCHALWLTDYKSEEPVRCPKCQLTNVEGGKKNISTAVVNEYACGSCGNTWTSDMLADKGDQYCKKCGCGIEAALKVKTEEESA